jgi:hypothetical protein
MHHCLRATASKTTSAPYLTSRITVIGKEMENIMLYCVICFGKGSKYRMLFQIVEINVLVVTYTCWLVGNDMPPRLPVDLRVTWTPLLQIWSLILMHVSFNSVSLLLFSQLISMYSNPRNNTIMVEQGPKGHVFTYFSFTMILN